MRYLGRGCGGDAERAHRRWAHDGRRGSISANFFQGSGHAVQGLECSAEGVGVVTVAAHRLREAQTALREAASEREAIEAARGGSGGGDRGRRRGHADRGGD